MNRSARRLMVGIARFYIYINKSSQVNESRFSQKKTKMLCIRISSQRIIREIFIPPRRSFTHQRPIEDLQQLYDLLKHESMSK